MNLQRQNDEQLTRIRKLWKTRRWWVLTVSALFVVAAMALWPRPVRVVYAQAREGPMKLAIAASGQVEGDSADLGFVGTGKIIEYFVQEGEAVQQGQLLARINRNDRPGTDDVMQAPYDGYVVAIYEKIGAVVGPTMPVLRVVQRGKVTVTAFIDSEDAAWIQVGDHFVCRAGGYLARAWPLRVQSIGHEAVPREDVAGSSRQVRVQMAVLDGDFALPPGTPVDIDGEVKIAVDALQIPASAVERREDRTFVWRLEGDHVKPVDVALGPNNFSYVVIKEGLEVGDKVVLEGKTDLQPGQKVNATLWEEPES